MTENWTITVDCSDARGQAGFWRLALGYVEAGAPQGWASWNDWFDHFGIPEEERNDGAAIEDPEGARPRISFLRVPEGKAAKNRLHLDIQAAGGRHVPQHLRESRIETVRERLVDAGATVSQRVDEDDRLDHYVMLDPEGNEFCIV